MNLFICWGCCNKLGGLKPQKFNLIVLKARSPKSKYWQALRRLQGVMLPCLFLASGGRPQSLVCRHIAPISASTVAWYCSCVFPCVSLFLTRIPVIALRVYPNAVWPDFNLTTSAKIPFLKKVTFTGIGVRTWTYLLKEHSSSQYSKVGETVMGLVAVLKYDSQGGCHWWGDDWLERRRPWGNELRGYGRKSTVIVLNLNETLDNNSWHIENFCVLDTVIINDLGVVSHKFHNPIRY